MRCIDEVCDRGKGLVSMPAPAVAQSFLLKPEIRPSRSASRCRVSRDDNCRTSTAGLHVWFGVPRPFAQEELRCDELLILHGPNLWPVGSPEVFCTAFQICSAVTLRSSSAGKRSVLRKSPSTRLKNPSRPTNSASGRSRASVVKAASMAVKDGNEAEAMAKALAEHIASNPRDAGLKFMIICGARSATS
jgi:hypothetical protein